MYNKKIVENFSFYSYQILPFIFGLIFIVIIILLSLENMKFYEEKALWKTMEFWESMGGFFIAYIIFLVLRYVVQIKTRYIWGVLLFLGVFGEFYNGDFLRYQALGVLDYIGLTENKVTIIDKVFFEYKPFDNN